MRIVDRLDPVLLERELLERVDAAHPRDRPGSTLIVVPTARLAEHVRRRLGAVRPAWLGLDVLDFDLLPREILSRASGPPIRVASNRVLSGLLERVAGQRPANAWSDFASRRPGTIGRLRETLEDLREAGVDPSVVQECCANDERDRGLAELYRAYAEALERSINSGWTDRAGMVRAATAHAAAYCGRLHAVFVHGAYEWTGVNLDLLREIDRTTEVTVLFPARFGAPVSCFAQRFAEAHLAAEPGVQDEVRREGALALEALYLEESRPEPAAGDRIGFAHAQGTDAEVKYAVRSALRDVAAGRAPGEIAIVARSLANYASALEQRFEDDKLPWTSSLRTPLRRRPVVRDFLLLLRVVEENFPRRSTVELLRSTRIDWSATGSRELAPPDADRIDAWSREARLVGGMEDWTVEFPRWAGEAKRLTDEREREVGRLAACLDALLHDVEPAPRGWRDHAARLRTLSKNYFGQAESNDADGALDRLDRLLDEMGQLESFVGDAEPVEFAVMRHWLEQAVDGCELQPYAPDGGGIRVLDAMQLRGLTFDRVYVLGMNSGLFPRTPREDPILGDVARAEIARRSGRPLGPKLDAADEERLLLALVLGSARDKVCVSWQRADESGKAATASLALRELARLRFGDPDLDRLRLEARHLPSHPTHALQAQLEDPGLLSPDDEMLLSVLSQRGPALAEDLRRRYPRLDRGLTMLQQTQSWTPGTTEFDARVGPSERERDLSVSAMESLGRCPLQFFFQSVLRVRRLEDETNPTAISGRDTGTGIHDLLQSIYQTLADEGWFESERRTGLIERGLQLLDERRDRVLGDLGRRLSRRLPLLWGTRTRNWAALLETRIRGDLARIERDGLRPLGFEEDRRERIELGNDLGVTLKARFDRRLEGPDGDLVGDYKVSKRLKERANPTNMLKGRELQVPLYRLLAGPGSSVELIGIHPELDEKDSRVEFQGFDTDEREESFVDTLRVLLRLRAAGSFPFNKDDHCNRCDYAAACRRGHPPSVARERHSADGAGYRELRRKSKTKPYG